MRAWRAALRARLELRGAHRRCSSRNVSRAFCACSRFSASSQTTLCGAVDDLGRDLLAAVGRQAVQDDRVGRGPGQGRRGHRVRHERRLALGLLVLLAHRDPGVGGDDVGAVERGRGISGDRDRTAGAGGDAFGGGHDRRIRLVAVGTGDADVQPGRGAAQQVGVRHVVGGVAQVGEGQPGQPLLVLAHRLQVGQDLAGVELVGQRVDDRDRADRRHLLDALLAVGPPHDRGDLAGEHARRVGDGLADPDAGQPSVDHDRVTTELGHPDRERQLRAQGLLVEDQGHGLRAGQRAVQVGLGLHRRRRGRAPRAVRPERGRRHAGSA